MSSLGSFLYPSRPVASMGPYGRLGEPHRAALLRSENAIRVAVSQRPAADLAVEWCCDGRDEKTGARCRWDQLPRCCLACLVAVHAFLGADVSEPSSTSLEPLSPQHSCLRLLARKHRTPDQLLDHRRSYRFPPACQRPGLAFLRSSLYC